MLNLPAITATAQKLPRLHSLLISLQGEIILEDYFNGRDASQPANMKSASKSVISALVGIAIREGFLKGVDQPIADFFPEYLAGSDGAKKRGITIENLLTMESGRESTSSRNYGRWVRSDDWIRFALDQPVVAPAGEQMIYSTGSTHLLSAIISRASGMDTRQFAQRYLTTPLGVRIAYWSRDPQGIYFGGNDMEMTPRAMLAFGEMYLNQGQHGDQQVLPPQWVAVSHEAHAVSPRGQGRFYGYGWWLRDLADMLVPVAWGYGGQLIFVIPRFELVVVATSDSTPASDRFGHLQSLYDLVEYQVLWPLRQAADRQMVGAR